MSAYVIGLTGGIACGKSNLSAALRSVGAHVIDADELSRAATAPGGPALPLIREKWGDRVFEGESLNRRALAGIIFQDAEARKQLNAIIHPLVFSAMRREIDRSEGVVVLDVPLLFETGMDEWCDEIWCAYLPQKEQMKRLAARDHISQREALRRIRSQMPTLEKARRSRRVIRTVGSREESAGLVLALWNELPQQKKSIEGDMAP